jgi:hypothetical protein
MLPKLSRLVGRQLTELDIRFSALSEFSPFFLILYFAHQALTTIFLSPTGLESVSKSSSKKLIALKAVADGFSGERSVEAENSDGSELKISP